MQDSSNLDQHRSNTYAINPALFEPASNTAEGETSTFETDIQREERLGNPLRIHHCTDADQSNGQCSEAVQIYQPAMRIEIPAVSTPSTATTDGFFKLRPWQANCSVALSNSRNWIINAPTAAGKAFEICILAANRIKQDANLRVIIAVPQTIIGAGFRHNKIELPDGTRVDWHLHRKHDLCDEKSRQSTAHLLKFLNGPTSQNAMDRVLLCTHATLGRAFGKNAAAFKNVLVIVDEAHHIKYGSNDELQVDITNKMGALAKCALHHRDTVQLGLTTATFFRGDQAPIIPDSADFAQFDLPYDEYLQTCRFLRSFSYDFVLYGSSFAEPVKHAFDRRIGKTIVYIPSVNSSSSIGTKTEDVSAVLRAIAGMDVPILADTDQPIMRVKRGEKWIKVVNLVDEANRARKLSAIIDAHNALDSSQIDVVIALGMLKEGANWRWADREIIIGHRGSLTEVLQMMGRSFRDVEGKTHVEILHLLPFAFDQTDRNQIQDDLNDYLSCILLSMLLENVVSPIYLPAVESDGKPATGGQRINYLKEAFADEGQAMAALAEIKDRVLDATAGDTTAEGMQRVQEVFPAIVSEVLSERGIYQYHEQIARQVFRMFNRRTVALQGLNVGRVNVDLIKENPVGCLLQYVSDACGVNTFNELRAASRAKAFLPFDRARTFVHGLCLKSVTEWYRYCGSGEKPEDIPSNPNAVYEHGGWVGYGDWLGTGRTRHFRAFPEARLFVRGLQLKSVAEWRAYRGSGQEPEDIPANPHAAYKHAGWVGYGDWLGTGRTRHFRGFPEARLFVRGLQLKSVAEWRTYCASGHKPPDIPSAPDAAYEGDGWAGFPDWLGAGHARTHRVFQEARRYVRALALQSVSEWKQYCNSGKKPNDIPSQPDRVYKNDGWSSYGDWLGTGKVNVRQVIWRPFQEAREFVRGLGLKSQLEWAGYCKSGRRPPDIPTNPNVVYRDAGWSCYRDWLGFEKTVKVTTAFRPFCNARKYVHTLGLTSASKWREYSSSGMRPLDIPSNPAVVYKDDGWAGFDDWLNGKSIHASGAA